MNATILNRNFEHPNDGWYQIEPRGEHPNVGSGVVQVIDLDASRAIVDAFNRQAQQPNFAGMLIDHEHFRHDPSKETVAYGWLMQLQNRDDGIYGQIRWTGTGRKAVDDGDYRYFSTEYAQQDLQSVLNAKPLKKVRPLKLDGLTLTNDPNNKGGKPITNRSASDSKGPYMNEDGTFKGGFDGCVLHMTNVEGHSKESATKICGYIASHVKNRSELSGWPGTSDDKLLPAGGNTKGKIMKSVATKLGLAAEASEETILAEVSKIINRATDAEGKITPLQTKVTELETLNGTLLGEQLDGLFDAHGVKEEKVRNRLKPVLMPLKNRADRIACLSELGFEQEEEGETETETEQKRGQVFNRRDSRQPAGKNANDGNADKAKADKILNRANELKKNGLSFDSAYAQATKEVMS
jgi:hypothetical protein